MRSPYSLSVRVDQMSLIDTCRILVSYVKYDPECMVCYDVAT